MDSHFISGDFFDLVLPKEKAYLQRYFNSEVQRTFLRYMHIFGSYKLFTEHTGLVCSVRMLQLLRQKLSRLESAHKEAKDSMNFEILELIESGKYRKF